MEYFVWDLQPNQKKFKVILTIILTIQLKMMSMSACETVLKNQCLEIGEKIVDVSNFSPCLSIFDFTSQLMFEFE